jgi:glucose-6-phosphate isomerase
MNEVVVDPVECQAWGLLIAEAERLQHSSIRQLLNHPRDYLKVEAGGVLFDFSRQRMDRGVLDALLTLAEETGVARARDAMFDGKEINLTEDRSVLHVALRAPRDAKYQAADLDVMADIHSVLERMEIFANSVRSGQWRGNTGQSITTVVNIGIGGSDLGPAMAYQALRAYRNPDITCHFVSNVDPADLTDVLTQLDPERTLFIIASKTFTTQETMANAARAREWIANALGDDAIASHFVAVSTAEDHVRSFGIDTENMFGFWNWVGGRYSMTSAIGLSTMIAIGPTNYRRLLSGFHAMDNHFQDTPADRNVPMLMGLLAVWNRNFLKIPTTAVLPYSQDLSRFPSYLQQLTMESNGKSVRRDGSPVNYETGGILWGEPGTNGQHSFYQLLHQGTDDVAQDIIVVARPSTSNATADRAILRQHDMLVANALAQASVLSVGLTADEVRAAGTEEFLVAHKVMPGNRPVSLVMVPELTPYELGVLISAYEHSVFVQGAVWQINPFDQWGVELGKKVAGGILRDIDARIAEDAQLDEATRASLTDYLGYRDSQ